MIELIEFFKENIATITTLLAGIGAWGYERNKRQLEIKKFETQNNKSIMDLYQEALDDLKTRYDADIKELEAKYDKKFQEMETRYNKLKVAFENYKKSHK